jgi:precorrin-2/cobalt-factor-2 C20-methyltransferase
MLIGVGLGPGDPQLLTLKAINVLQAATRVFVPGKMSYELVRPYADAEILKFPMTNDGSELRDAWESNVHIIAQFAAKGTVAFGVMGDPNVFSTFSHLRKMMKELRPDIIVETVPGVSAITSCVSRINVPLEKSFIVSDGSSIESKIVLKVKRPQELADKLVADGYREFILIERAFTNKERVYREDFPQQCDYFSIMYGKRT